MPRGGTIWRARNRLVDYFILDDSGSAHKKTGKLHYESPHHRRHPSRDGKAVYQNLGGPIPPPPPRAGHPTAPSPLQTPPAPPLVRRRRAARFPHIGAKKARSAVKALSASRAGEQAPLRREHEERRPGAPPLKPGPPPLHAPPRPSPARVAAAYAPTVADLLASASFFHSWCHSVTS